MERTDPEAAGATLPAGAQLAGYRVEGVVGRGGMATVYRAVDLALRRTIALKVFAPGVADDPSLRARFIREAQLAASLEHEHVVPVHAAGEADGRLFIAMRLVEGRDLASVIAADAPLDPARTVALLGGVARALDAAHARGMVHRDVKPGNILVAERDGAEHAYLADFGITHERADGAGLTRDGLFIGSVAYAAPEQILGGDVDARTDEYALACVAFECLTGALPFRRQTDVTLLMAHLNEPPPKVSSFRPELAQLDDVITAGMAKEPGARYASAGALLGALATRVASIRGAQPHPGGETAASPEVQPASPSRGASSAPLLFGRERDLQRVLAALDEHRLVSLTGPGGTGKTRLARAVLEAIAAGPAVDGLETAFIDASPLTDTALLAPTILAGVTLRGEGGGDPDADRDPLAAIARRFAGRPAVVVVDNVEQLPGADAVIDAVLAGSPTLRILATSRIPLGLPEEAEVHVPPLELPRGSDPAGVEASPAGALFLARARSIGRLDRPDAAEAEAIAGLCRRLDGLPLAIELAAGRTRILTPREILARLDRLGIGSIDPGGSDGRRSMTAILDWTMGLLDGPQRHALDAAAACDGFDLDLLETILDGEDASPALEELVALGLVTLAGAPFGTTRYRLLEVIRAYVAAGPASAAASGSLAAAHATAIAERAGVLWLAADGGDHDAMRRMDLDLDNDRRALSYLAAHDRDRGLRLWRRMHGVWANGRTREAVEWFERLAPPPRAPSLELARSLSNQSRYLAHIGEVDAAHEARLEGAAMSEVVGDGVARASALAALAQGALLSGDTAEAERVTASLRELLDDDDLETRLHAGEALAIAYIAIDGPTGDRAVETFEALIDVARGAHRSQMVASWLCNVAFLELCRGHAGAAAHAGEAALAEGRDVDDTLLAVALLYLAVARARLGLADEATSALAEALASDTLGVDSTLTGDVLRAGAEVELAHGRSNVAARLAGAADHRAATADDEMDAGDRLLLDQTMAAIRIRAPGPDTEQAFRDGAVADERALVAELSASVTRPSG